jgi:hypothetical protein
MNRLKQIFYHIGGMTLGIAFHLSGIHRALFDEWEDQMKKTVALIFALLCIAWFAFILSGGANREVVWFIVPIGGLFRMISGTWNKVVGRFLTPALPVVASLLLVGFSWWLPVIYLAYLSINTLPFTLVGNSVQGSWINWGWIWILGYLNGIGALTIGIPLSLIMTTTLLAFIPMVIYGISGTLSNVKSTAKAFPWKLCEFLFGSSAMIPVAYLLNK